MGQEAGLETSLRCGLTRPIHNMVLVTDTLKAVVRPELKWCCWWAEELQVELLKATKAISAYADLAV